MNAPEIDYEHRDAEHEHEHEWEDRQDAEVVDLPRKTTGVGVRSFRHSLVLVLRA